MQPKYDSMQLFPLSKTAALSKKIWSNVFIDLLRILAMQCDAILICYPFVISVAKRCDTVSLSCSLSILLFYWTIEIIYWKREIEREIRWLKSLYSSRVDFKWVLHFIGKETLPTIDHLNWFLFIVISFSVFGHKLVWGSYLLEWIAAVYVYLTIFREDAKAVRPETALPCCLPCYCLPYYVDDVWWIWLVSIVEQQQNAVLFLLLA